MLKKCFNLKINNSSLTSWQSSTKVLKVFENWEPQNPTGKKWFCADSKKGVRLADKNGEREGVSRTPNHRRGEGRTMSPQQLTSQQITFAFMNWRFGAIHDSFRLSSEDPRWPFDSDDPSDFKPGSCPLQYSTYLWHDNQLVFFRTRWKAKLWKMTIIRKLENSEFTSGLRLDFVRKLLKATAKYFFFLKKLRSIQ